MLEGQQVYFTNPDGITSILSRITGGNPSNIFGTLGVDGNSKFIFAPIPMALYVGENAAPGYRGLFLCLNSRGYFVWAMKFTVQPNRKQSNLLTVNPSALFSSYLTNASGDIENKGQLLAGDNLALVCK